MLHVITLTQTVSCSSFGRLITFVRSLRPTPAASQAWAQLNMSNMCAEDQTALLEGAAKTTANTAAQSNRQLSGDYVVHSCSLAVREL
jgi:hypothetical protein